MHLCFVCSGNTCRSAMAAMVFRAHLARAGLDDVRVTSAGTGGWHAGEPADPRARAVLAAHGYGGEHVATELGDEHLGADLFLAAGREHAEVLSAKVGAGRVRLLREFDPEAPPGAEIADPYHGRAEEYEKVLEMIEAAVPGLLDWVHRHR
ncbi:protein-tyrosine-phosphatase [Amycolatopsis deserti]|uniref:protein-tyrosine-phosphatase n=1 Tax=Amycolatopsis deserti TaxID=185696 RepID=A0ABQ3JDL0_9PSEU|nr:protein-tyrosine-phosphatase [Amycolatopsis deserti]